MSFLGFLLLLCQLIQKCVLQGLSENTTATAISNGCDANMMLGGSQKLMVYLEINHHLWNFHHWPFPMLLSSVDYKIHLQMYFPDHILYILVHINWNTHCHILYSCEPPAPPTKKFTAKRFQFLGIITREYLDQIKPEKQVVMWTVSHLDVNSFERISKL